MKGSTTLLMQLYQLYTVSQLSHRFCMLCICFIELSVFLSVYMQIGTEDSPFMHKAVVTLHGTVKDPEIPVYGAKVIGVRQGDLDLHGKPRNVTWTRLQETAAKNDTFLLLQVCLCVQYISHDCANT